MTRQRAYPHGKRGFAAMDPDKQREIAMKGGITAHVTGRAHQWTSQEAAEAGRKGGRISRGGKGHAFTPDHNGECLICDEPAEAHV